MDSVKRHGLVFSSSLIKFRTGECLIDTGLILVTAVPAPSLKSLGIATAREGLLLSIGFDKINQPLDSSAHSFDRIKKPSRIPLTLSVAFKKPETEKLTTSEAPKTPGKRHLQIKPAPNAKF